MEPPHHLLAKGARSCEGWGPCSSLQLLDIAGNQLTEIPGGLPESLEYLYLQNNKISAVPANAFDSTPNLKGIFLR